MSPTGVFPTTVAPPSPPIFSSDWSMLSTSTTITGPGVPAWARYDQRVSTHLRHGLHLPAEDLLVEAAGPVPVVERDLEVHDPTTHLRYLRLDLDLSRRRLDPARPAHQG